MLSKMTLLVFFWVLLGYAISIEGSTLALALMLKSRKLH